MAESKSLTALPEWQALNTHAARLRDVPLRRLFADDAERAARFSLEAAGVFLDAKPPPRSIASMRMPRSVSSDRAKSPSDCAASR